MTTATSRELGRLRGVKHRARTKQGIAVYRVQVHEQQLLDALVGWGMPAALTGRHDLAEGAVGDLVGLMISDKIITGRIHELIKRRR